MTALSSALVENIMEAVMRGEGEMIKPSCTGSRCLHHEGFLSSLLFLLVHELRDGEILLHNMSSPLNESTWEISSDTEEYLSSLLGYSESSQVDSEN